MLFNLWNQNNIKKVAAGRAESEFAGEQRVGEHVRQRPQGVSETRARDCRAQLDESRLAV